MRHVIVAAAYFVCACVSSSAITGTVAQIRLQTATDAELLESPLPLGVLVQRAEDKSELLIGDGSTVPGLSLRGTGVSWPLTALGELDMSSWHVRMNGGFSMNAEAGRFTIWNGTNYALQIIQNDLLASSNVLSVTASGTNLLFSVASETEDVVVESCTSLEDPVWEVASIAVERTTPLIVQVIVPMPPLDSFRFYRVRSIISGIGMYVSVPLYVAALNVDGFNVTSNAVESWNAAYGWGDHSTNGYLTGFAETDSVFVASAAYGVTTNLIANWNAAYGWGDHSTNGYLLGATITTGATASVTTNAGILALTIPAPESGGGISATEGTNIAQTVATGYGFTTTGSVVAAFVSLTGGTMIDGALISADGDFTLSGAGASIFFGTDPYLSGWNSLSASNIVANTNLTVGGHAVLTQETDSVWAAWRTNAAPGTKNAILPDGSLVDIGPFLNGETLISEVYPQQLSLADGFVTVWSTGKWAQAYTAAAGSVATVRVVRAAASLTNAVAAIPFWLCCGTNFITFQTNNLLGFATSQVSTNGSTNLFLLDAMPGSTNFYMLKIR